jgi:N-acyl homoserine lactone hydrolase
MISLPNTGKVLLCSDAIYSQDNVDFEAWGSQAEPEVAKASAHRLLDLAKEKSALLVYGHDPIQWKSLRHAPLYYD